MRTLTSETHVEHLQRILGCVIVGGGCVVHQRLMDRPRPGCPLAASILREGKSR